jgi:hypothetical protein
MLGGSGIIHVKKLIWGLVVMDRLLESAIASGRGDDGPISAKDVFVYIHGLCPSFSKRDGR